MKLRLTLLLMLTCLLAVSQTPPLKINYQGVARSATGTPFVSQAIGVQFRILQGSPGGSPVFSEAQALTTNGLGLFNTQIGATTNLASVNWAAGPYFLELSIDTTGGTAYVPVGTQELVSVPYALYSAYSASAASAPAPAVSISGTVLTVGTNTVGLPSSTPTPSTSIVTSGGINSSLTGNTYSLDVPQIALTSTLTYGPAPSQTIGGLAQVLGTYPNFTVLVAPVIGYDPNEGILSFTSAPFTTPVYDYTYNITPALNLNGNILSLGPVSNSVTIPISSTANASVVSSGALVTTTLGVNSYSLHVPVPVITGSNALQVSGSYPNWTLNVPANATPPTSITASGSGGAVVTPVGTNSFDIAVPAVNLTPAGGGITGIGGAYPNLTITAPSVSVVHNPTLGLAQVSGAFPNYTVTVAPSFNYVNSTGSLVVTNPANPALSYSFNVTPTLAYNAATGLLTSGPGSNTVTIPSAITTSIAGSGAASVNPLSGSSFTVSVPQTTVYSSDNTATITSAGTNSFDISVPQMTLTAVDGAAVSGAYPSYTIGAPPQFNLTTTGAITKSGAYPNISIGASVVNVSGGFGPYPSGLLQVMGSYPNYGLVVAPDIGYSSTTGLLTIKSLPFSSPAYNYTYNITPSLTESNNIIQSGPTSNTVNLALPAAQAFNVNSATLLASSTPAQLSGSFNFTKQSANSEIDVFVHTQVFSGTFTAASNIAFEIRIDNNVSTISIPEYVDFSASNPYVTLKAVFAGLSAGAHTASIWAYVNAGTSAAVQLDPNNRGGKLILKETY